MYSRVSRANPRPTNRLGFNSTASSQFAVAATAAHGLGIVCAARRFCPGTGANAASATTCATAGSYGGADAGKAQRAGAIEAADSGRFCASKPATCASHFQ